MIYAPEDVKRLLDTVLKRVLEKNPDFGADEQDDLEEIIEDLKEDL